MTAATQYAGGVNPGSHQHTNISTQTTTAVKASQGTLVGIMVNTKAANGVITVYDNTAGSGTTIATITAPATLLDNAQYFHYGVHFRTGLTIVTATATQNITVIWD